MTSEPICTFNGKKERPENWYSKKCLIFGIISIEILTVAVVIFNIMQRMEIFSLESIESLFLLAIPFLVVFYIGSVFGIFSWKYKKRAEWEVDNDFRKAGSIVGKLGLALNIVGFAYTIWSLIWVGRYIVLYG